MNALKEGWDCPFAYILASLADRSSAVDVEQILGRVLRLPHVRKNENVMLNMSYVFTASAKFSETLDSIVKGLNRAGFSSRDYRQVEIENAPASATITPATASASPSTSSVQQTEDFDLSQILWNAESENKGTMISASDENVQENTNQITGSSSNENSVMAAIEKQALQENEALEKQVSERKSMPTPPPEMERQVKIYRIKDIFKESAASIKLPQFFMNRPTEGMHADLFGIQNTPFEKNMLLKGFPLRNADTNIDFNHLEIDMRSIDLDESQRDCTPTIFKVKDYQQQEIVRWLLNIDDVKKKRQKCAERLRDWIGDMYPIPDPDIVAYIARVLENFSDSDLDGMLNSQSEYANKIKEKINVLSAEYVEKEFDKALDQDKIVLRPSFKLPLELTFATPAKPLPKMLHEKEENINGFEEEVINTVANLENIEFWTRNRDKKDFCINGFINHYPDFIIKTKHGKIVLLETKGDHLDAEKKIKLGNLWATKAGNNYRYCLVYEKRKVEHAYTKDEFIATLKEW